MHELKNAGGQTGCVGGLGKKSAASRRPFTGLENDWAAGGHRCSRFPDSRGRWRIPRREHNGRSPRVAAQTNWAAGSLPREVNAVSIPAKLLHNSSYLIGAAASHRLSYRRDDARVEALDCADGLRSDSQFIGKALECLSSPFNAEVEPRFVCMDAMCGLHRRFDGV